MTLDDKAQPRREAQVQRTLAGLVAVSAAEQPVAFRTETFSEFVAAQVMAHLPEDERAPALAWLSSFSDQLRNPKAEG